jgi:hypothetical protein
VSHVYNLYQSDNTALFQLIDRAVISHQSSVIRHDVAVTIAPFRRTQNGRAAYRAIVNQHAGRHVWDMGQEHQGCARCATYKDVEWYYIHHSPSAHIEHRKAFIQLTKAAEHTLAEVPNSRQRVTNLLDSMKTQ